MGTEARDDGIDKRKTSKQMGSMEIKRQAKPHKHKETSAAPFLASSLLNPLQYCNQHIHYAQYGSPLPNSQLYYYQPQVMPTNRAPQLYPVYYHNRPPHAYSNAVGYTFQDFTLPVSGKGKDTPTPSKKKLDSMRQFEGSSEVVGLSGDRSSRSEMEDSTSYRNSTHDPSKSVACGDNEASPDEGYDIKRDLSATKKPRLNQINANDDSVMADSALDILETAPNLEMSYSSAAPVSKSTNTRDDYEMRKQRRREMNRESAKRSRLRKQQEHEKLQAKIEALKADSSVLCEELKNLSEECERLDEENKQIKEELLQMYGPSVLNNLAASWPELRGNEYERNVEMKLDL